MGWPSRAWTAALAAAPLRLWALFAAGPITTASAAGLVWIVWAGDWPTDLRGAQLNFLGYAMLAVIAINAVIVVTLAAVKVRGSVLGTTLEIDGDDDDPAPTKTTVTVEQATAA